MKKLFIFIYVLAFIFIGGILRLANAEDLIPTDTTIPTITTPLYTVNVKVTDKNENVLKNASVRLIDPEYIQARDSLLTNEKGEVVFENITLGKHTLEMHYDYLTIQKNIEVQGENPIIDININTGDLLLDNSLNKGMSREDKVTLTIITIIIILVLLRIAKVKGHLLNEILFKKVDIKAIE